jgi:hypothetical protein
MKYNAVIEGYINLGHASYLSNEEAEKRSDRTCYLPHHGVVSNRHVLGHRENVSSSVSS